MQHQQQIFTPSEQYNKPADEACAAGLCFTTPGLNMH